MLDVALPAISPQAVDSFFSLALGFAVAGLKDFVSFVGEQFRQRLTQDLLVFDDENGFAHDRCSSSPSQSFNFANGAHLRAHWLTRDLFICQIATRVGFPDIAGAYFRAGS